MLLTSGCEGLGLRQRVRGSGVQYFTDLVCIFVHDCMTSPSFITVMLNFVHSVKQKSIGLKFSKSRTGSHVTYSCHHKSSRFTFPGVRLAVPLEKDEAIGPSPS